MHDPDNTLDGALAEASQAFDQHTQTLAEIDHSYGDLAPYNLERAITEARFFLGQTAESLIEAGKRLLLIKEHEGHGGFMPALERIGIEYTAATRIMKIATKFGKANIATLQHLNGIGKVKLLELAILDDEEIQGLGQGETVRGLVLDDVATMSVRELRAALRKAKADAEQQRREAKDQEERLGQLLEHKDRKINELDMALTRRQETSQTLIFMQGLEEDLQKAVLQIAATIQTTLAGRLRALAEVSDGPERAAYFQMLAAGELGKLMASVRMVAADFDVLPDPNPASLFAEASGDDLAGIWDAVNADLDAAGA